MSNSGTKIHGKHASLYIGGPKDPSTPLTPGVGYGIRVANKTEWSLNLGRDYVESTVFGDTNKTYLVGLRDLQGNYTGFLDVSGDLLLEATTSDTILLYLYAEDTSTDGTLIASGPALFDANVTAAINDAVKMTGNFRASGPWAVNL
jgi:hypothetical protein